MNRVRNQDAENPVDRELSRISDTLFPHSYCTNK